MKTNLAIAVTVVLLVAALLWRHPVTQLLRPATHERGPFACDVRAMTSEQRKRHFEELGPALRSLKTGVRELPNGFEFQFPSDAKTYQLLAEWAAGERVCCPFLSIDLNSEREGGPLWLRLTGRDGVKQFLQAEGMAWTKP